ncbi:tol-pal system YbgF family protein [Melioribacteraceae bacterium 4301-Me]|uniref:tetratricopeptide repeat protein n=1 Tax=Pyranulibacter aquaticus TaxID=3163344 RepID=UPI003596EF32
MLEKKKRITKKEIKQDKLVTTYYKVVEFYQQNQLKIFITGGIIILLIAALVLYNNKQKKDDLLASALLAKVIPLYDSGDYTKAIDGDKTQNIIGLKEIVKNYGSTETGETAKIYLGNCYYYTGKSDLAFTTFDDYGGDNPILKAAALAGKASCLEDKKEFEKAAKLLADAEKISKINPANSEYLLRASEDFIKVNQKEKAKELLTKIKNEYKNTTAAQQVEKYMVQIES